MEIIAIIGVFLFVEDELDLERRTSDRLNCGIQIHLWKGMEEFVGASFPTWEFGSILPNSNGFKWKRRWRVSDFLSIFLRTSWDFLELCQRAHGLPHSPVDHLGQCKGFISQLSPASRHYNLKDGSDESTWRLSDRIPWCSSEMRFFRLPLAWRLQTCDHIEPIRTCPICEPPCEWGWLHGFWIRIIVTRVHWISLWRFETPHVEVGVSDPIPASFTLSIPPLTISALRRSGSFPTNCDSTGSCQVIKEIN